MKRFTVPKFMKTCWNAISKKYVIAAAYVIAICVSTLVIVNAITDSNCTIASAPSVYAEMDEEEISTSEEVSETTTDTTTTTTETEPTTTTTTTTTEETTTTTTSSEVTTTKETTTVVTTTQKKKTTAKTTATTTTAKKTESSKTTTTTVAVEANNSGSDASGLPITQAEFYMLANLVAHEYGADWVATAEKAKVVAVVMNRVRDSRFPNTIRSVILQRNQFCWVPDSYYWRRTTQGCKNAVIYYFNHQSEFSRSINSFWGDGRVNHFYHG